MFMSTLHAQEFFDQVFDRNEPQSCTLLSFKNPRCVFVEAFSEKISSSKDTLSLAKLKCDKGHPFSKFMKIASVKIFNVGSKNYVSEENSKIHAARKNKRKNYSSKDNIKQPAPRKIAKLQSDKV